MNISQDQVSSIKDIGNLRDSKVFEVMTKGGLFLVVGSKNGKRVTLGAGPHRAIARFIAKESEPELNITELSKSDSLDAIDLNNSLPACRVLTKKIQSIGF